MARLLRTLARNWEVAWARSAPPKRDRSIRGGSSLKKLFLSHYNGDASEVALLAEQLRVRGIVPWVDKQGGFLIGDRNETEARRAIKDDCFGCLLYATPAVFGRPFITDIEMPAAIEQHSLDASYLIFAVTRGLSFSDLASKSLDAFGLNLADHHCIPVSDDAMPDGLARVARETLAKLICGHSVQPKAVVRIQYSTREIFPPGEDEQLLIDGRSAYGGDNPLAWGDLLLGLRDVKKAIVKAFGRPTIIVEGSKHLTSAFLFGRAFQPFELQIRQTISDYWSTSGPLRELELDVISQVRAADEFVVTIASGAKMLQAKAMEAVGVTTASRLDVSPSDGRFDLAADSSRWLAKTIYEHLDKAVAQAKPQRIHLFMAIPQATAMHLGQKFAGMPDTLVYDWNGRDYEAGRLIPGGAL